MARPRILVTNDDGIVAPGIRALVEVASKYGDVTVVAPDSPQSGQGHAITLENPLRLHKVNIFDGIDAYECTGTPADCVKLGKNVLFKNQKIDLCLSGINHGANSSINILYSGTMSAAMEASLEGIDSIGFSLLDFEFDADFSSAKYYADILIKKVLSDGLDGCNLLNVNIPKGDKETIKGMKICRQGKGTWVEDFQEALDPRGRKYYWLAGKFVNEDYGDDTDIWALENNYVSIVPCDHDLTKHTALDKITHLVK